MATYPTGVYSPSVKAAGQTITAAMWNDPDGEITAIEDALKNGIAHAVTISTGGLTVSTGSVNIGGPSSLTTLSVSGGSTFAGPVTFSSGVTFNGTVSNLTLTVPVVRLTHSASQNVAHNTWTALNWDTEAEDASGMHSTAANSSRITFAHSTGLYNVSLSVPWSTGAVSGHRVLSLVMNDSSGVAAQGAPTPGSADFILPQSVQATVRVTSTADYITARVFQTSGSTMSVSPTSSLYALVFSAYKVGA